MRRKNTLAACRPVVSRASRLSRVGGGHYAMRFRIRQGRTGTSHSPGRSHEYIYLLRNKDLSLGKEKPQVKGHQESRSEGCGTVLLLARPKARPERGRQTMLVGMRKKNPQGTILPLDFLDKLDRIRVPNPTTARSSQKQCEAWRAVTVSRFLSCRYPNQSDASNKS